MNWLEYDAIHSSCNHDQFSINVPVVFNNLIKAHFVSEFVGGQHIVFNINKIIVKIIVNNMMSRVEDEIDSDNENVKENLGFGNEA